MTLMPPGWFPDPRSPAQLRWWDGTAWTSHVQQSPAPAAQPSQPTSLQSPASPAIPLPRRNMAIWIVLLVAGVLIGTTGVFMGAMPIVRATSSDNILSIPGDATFDLDAGSYMIYEHTGTSARSGPVTTYRKQTPTTDRSRVRVVDSSGQSLNIRPQGFGATHTLTRGNDTYTGVAQFTVTSAGTYTVEVPRADPGQAVVAPTLGDLFRELLPWAGLGLLGFLLALIGLVMLIVVLVKNRRARPA